jgi:predicted  nucleic acid-binding Zn-ribbon protein
MSPRILSRIASMRIQTKQTCQVEKLTVDLKAEREAHVQTKLTLESATQYIKNAESRIHELEQRFSALSTTKSKYEDANALTTKQYKHLLTLTRRNLADKDLVIAYLREQLEEKKVKQDDAEGKLDVCEYEEWNDAEDNDDEAADRFEEQDWDFDDPTYRSQMWVGGKCVIDCGPFDSDSDKDSE